MKNTQIGFAWRSILITVAAVVALIAVLGTLLPRGYKDDLSSIGKGTGTVVLIHNKNGAKSLELMGVVDKVRSDFQDRVDFLIAEVDTASGRAFMQSQQVTNVGLIFFSPGGERLRFVDGPVDKAGLRAELDRAFPKPN